MTTKVTELEAKVLVDIMTNSEFNGDILNTALRFNEQELEQPDVYQAFVDAEIRAKRLNIKINVLKGVLGSLSRKKLIVIDNSEDVDWLLIFEDNYNAILQAMEETNV